MKDNKKKLYFRRTIRTLCFFLAIIATCLVLQRYFLRNTDHNSLRIEGFYQEDRDSLDAVLIGASDIYTSFIPGRAYDRCKLTSYLLASESITAQGVKTAVKEVVRTQHPECIIIEANAFLYGASDNESNQAHIHKFFDNLPLSVNKLEFIQKKVPADERAEYFFPLMKYHGTWTEYPERFHLAASDIALQARGYNYLKGFRTTTDIYNSSKPGLNDSLSSVTEELDLNPDLEKELLDLLDYCKKRDLNVIFIRAPHFVTEKTLDRVKRSQKMASFVRDFGYSYYTFENDVKKIGINDKHDFYNEDHMNIYGALKFTDYVCDKLIQEEGIVPEPLNDTQREIWENAAKSSNQLYRYCNDMMMRGEVRGAQEDVLTLTSLPNYSDAPIESKEGR
ncbi:MAG: hypothetical protein IIZ07_07470 [Ruminococcus sp.]|nr:hypothetical protein [Ruminococcus sp.]